MSKRGAKPDRPTSDELLSDLKSIEIRLESGKVVLLSMEAELEVPTDPTELMRAIRTSASRYAFWAAQTERAYAAVRIQERRLKDAEARAYLIAHKYHHECTEGQYIAKELVQAQAQIMDDSDNPTKSVQSLRTRLQTLRTHYSTLRAMRDAIDHRAHVLRRIALQSGTTQ